MRTKSTIVTISFAAFTLGLGAFLGYFLGSIFNTAHADNDGYVTPVMDDVEKINKDFENFLNGRNINDVDLTQTSFSVSDIYNVANYKINQHEKVFNISNVLSLAKNSLLGNVQTDIFVSYIKIKNSYFVESDTASGFVNNGNRFVLNDINENKTQFYQSKKITATRDGNTLKNVLVQYEKSNIKNHSDVDKNLPDPESTDFTQEEIVKYFGRGTTVPTVYLVSNDTVLKEPVTVADEINGDETQTTSITKTNYGYKLTLCLDPQKAIINYAKQMNSENPAVYDPLYEGVILEIDTTPDLTVIRKRVHEKVYVYPAQTNGGEAPTNNLSYDYYYYDDQVKIDFPTIDTTIDYSTYWEMKDAINL